MSDTSGTLALDHLLANAAWARRLARRLTRNADDGDDLVQDAAVAALEKPAAPSGPARPWMTTVVTNLFRNRLRSDRRRWRREQAIARPEGDDCRTPGAEETLAGLQVHRRLAELVSELPEPYRQTVTLRYFEDRSAADIAALSGVPAGTVRWRLKTGLDQLRARLDESAGGRKRWMALLVPFGAGTRPGEAERGGGGASPALLSGAGLRAALVGLMVTVVVGGGMLLLRLRPASLRASAVSEDVAFSPGSAGLPPGGRPPLPSALPAFVAPSSATTLALCTSRIEDLRRRERELLMKIDGTQLFEAGLPNPTAQAAIEGELQRALAPFPRVVAGQVFECRTYACRLLLLLRQGDYDGQSVAIHAALYGVMGARARSRSVSYDIAPGERKLLGVQDLSGETISIVRSIHALEDVSGRPVPVGALAPGEPRARRAVHQVMADLPPLRSLESCQAEVNVADPRVEAMAKRWDETKPLWVRFEERSADPAVSRQVTSELRRAMGALGHAWFHVVSCHGRICQLDADNPSDHAKRNQLVRVTDDIVKRDPWFSRRVSGRSQAGAVYFEVLEP